MIPPFGLPSDPSIKVHLKESTVADALTFADVDIDHEEEVTTLFLKTLQPPERYSDSQQWTGEDRRFALFWYWIHTEKNTAVPLKYDCDFCGKPHTYGFDFKSMVEHYTSIKGKPFREIEFNGEKITVKPLNGKNLEDLELMQAQLNLIENENDQGVKSGAYQKQKALINLTRLLMVIDFTADKEQDPEKRYSNREDKVLAMTGSKFADLMNLVEGALADMVHGLNSAYENGRIDLVTPPHKCPNREEKEAKTRIRVPFWNSDYIPRL